MTTPLECAALDYVRCRIMADVACPAALRASLLTWCGWCDGADNEAATVQHTIPALVTLPAKRAYRRRVPAVSGEAVVLKVKGKPGRKARLPGTVSNLGPGTLLWDGVDLDMSVSMPVIHIPSE